MTSSPESRPPIRPLVPDDLDTVWLIHEEGNADVAAREPLLPNAVAHRRPALWLKRGFRPLLETMVFEPAKSPRP